MSNEIVMDLTQQFSSCLRPELIRLLKDVIRIWQWVSIYIIKCTYWMWNGDSLSQIFLTNPSFQTITPLLQCYQPDCSNPHKLYPLSIWFATIPIQSTKYPPLAAKSSAKVYSGKW